MGKGPSRQKKRILDAMGGSAGSIFCIAEAKNSETLAFLQKVQESETAKIIKKLVEEKTPEEVVFHRTPRVKLSETGLVFHRNDSGKLECLGTVAEFCSKLAKEIKDKDVTD